MHWIATQPDCFRLRRAHWFGRKAHRRIYRNPKDFDTLWASMRFICSSSRKPSARRMNALTVFGNMDRRHNSGIGPQTARPFDQGCGMEPLSPHKLSCFHAAGRRKYAKLPNLEGPCLPSYKGPSTRAKMMAKASDIRSPLRRRHLP